MRSLVPSGFPCEKIYSLGCRAMAEHRHLLDSPKLDVLGFIQMPQLAKEEVDTSLMHGIDRPWWKIHLFRNTDRIVLTLCRGGLFISAELCVPLFQVRVPAYESVRSRNHPN